MSIADYPLPLASNGETLPLPPPDERRRLHRLAHVRRLQGVSRRTMARRLNTDVREIKRQEEPTCDISLSQLYRWQSALDVPLSELLADNDAPLSVPVLKRAQMVRLMKTVMAILERSQQASIRRMAQMLVEQMVEVMPELKGVSPWHSVGRRRTQTEVGQAAERRFPTSRIRLSADE